VSATARLPAVAALDIADVWRGRELARTPEKVVSTGFASLDAQLPGGGWPQGSLVEVLQARPGQHAWQLLLPALAQAAQEQQGPVVLVGAPFQPFGPSLQAQGLPVACLLKIQADKAAARLWAGEQALRCAEVAAVVAWLPQCNSNELRRLHLTAQQHGKFFFVFRPVQSSQQSSPARVQLLVEGVEPMQVRILKRRGPPLLEPVLLPAHPQRLAALLQSRKSRGRPVLPVPIPDRSRSHVLDRTEAIA
jgi:protein ImuA